MYVLYVCTVLYAVRMYCMYVCTYVHMYICTHVCMYIRTYVCSSAVQPALEVPGLVHTPVAHTYISLSS